jgi:hypothetical protein
MKNYAVAETHQSMPYDFSQGSWKRNVLTVISLHFHKLIEIQSILFQVFLHIIQSFCVRIRSSGHDVNGYWKKKTRLCRSELHENCSHYVEPMERRPMERLSRNLATYIHIRPSFKMNLCYSPAVCSELCSLIEICGNPC